MAFKALLMASGKPKPPLPPKPATTAPTAASKGALQGGAKPAGEEKPAVIGAKPLVIEEEKPRAKAKPNAGERDNDLLDPSARLAAQLAPPMASAPSTTTIEQVTQRARVSLEELVPQVLRRIAWGGDRTKGSVHLELTSGDKITVHAEGRRVRVEVDGNPDLEARIGSRLRAAGIEVEGIR